MAGINYKLILYALIVLSACSTNEQRTPSKETTKQTNKVVPKFNTDSAYYFIEKQVSFGPRVISSVAWKNCAVWLEQKLKSYTPNVLVQQATIKTYDNKTHNLKNIIASFSPERNNRIVLFAHWDSRHVADQDIENKTTPILGANDGGSGVGILLELSRQFKQNNPKIGVDIILFDAEDYGQPENSGFPNMQNSWCLGSQYWSKHPHTTNYFPKYGILLDMVGGKDAQFYWEGNSVYFASTVLQRVWDNANKLGFGKHFIYQEAPEIIDDHLYVNYHAHIPTIDIIEYNETTQSHFNQYWHTHQDDMNNIDKTTLHAVGQTLLEVIYTEN